MLVRQAGSDPNTHHPSHGFPYSGTPETGKKKKNKKQKHARTRRQQPSRSDRKFQPFKFKPRRRSHGAPPACQKMASAVTPAQFRGRRSWNPQTARKQMGSGNPNHAGERTYSSGSLRDGKSTTLVGCNHPLPNGQMFLVQGHLEFVSFQPVSRTIAPQVLGSSDVVPGQARDAREPSWKRRSGGLAGS